MSVNNRISKDLCSIHYGTLDEAIAVFVDLGPGALLGKNFFDIMEAYCYIPTEDRPLLRMA